MFRLLSAAKKKQPENEPAARGPLGRFRKDVRGTAALEFAFIAPPFFLLLFSVFEVGLTYTADAVLQSAVNDTARMIRTGQVQTAGLTPEKFRDEVCERVTIFLNCDERLQIDVRRFTSFTGAGFTSPLTADGEFRNDFRYEPGDPCDIILVRAFYKWDPITPGLGDAMKNMGSDAEGNSSSRLLQATAAVRNEPFQSSGPVCGS